MKNRVLKTLAWANGISFVVSACCVDSDSWIPWVVCMANLTWLALFAGANGWFEKTERANIGKERPTKGQGTPTSTPIVAQTESRINDFCNMEEKFYE